MASAIVPISSSATGSTTTTTPVKGNWNEQKGKLKAKFSTLTDADLHYEEGKKDEMFTKVQTKFGFYLGISIF